MLKVPAVYLWLIIFAGNRPRTDQDSPSRELVPAGFSFPDNDNDDDEGGMRDLFNQGADYVTFSDFQGFIWHLNSPSFILVLGKGVDACS